MRRFLQLLWVAGAVVGVVAEWISFGWGEPRHWVPDLLTGWALIACGLIAWSRRSESRSGALMTATGFSWFFGNFANVGVAPVAWLAAHAVFLYRGPLAQLLVTYPSGHCSSRLERCAVAVAYAVALITAVWQSEMATIGLAVLLVSSCTRSYLVTVGPMRRLRRLALWAAVGLGLVLVGGAAAHLAVPSGTANEPSLLALEATLCAIAGGLLAALLAAPSERTVVTDLVVELGESRSDVLRDELSRALGDPTLEIGYALSGGDVLVDSEGRPFLLPEHGSDRAVTIVERGGRRIAALVHDPSVLDDSELRDAVSSAAQLAAANARLQADVRVQVAELRDSRRRILEAGDEERRRLEQRVHSGPEQRLKRLAGILRQARLSARGDVAKAKIGRSETQLTLALEELRQLSHGLHPRVLAEVGLQEALASLAEQAPVPVHVTVEGSRLPPRVEAAAYFLCSEALANIAKHASASRVSVSVIPGDRQVRVEVDDDGVGGADAGRGTGLRGLADRVEALGGTLRVESPAGEGTRLIADIPLRPGGVERGGAIRSSSRAGRST
jgi:signal transduction histidine kinase